MCWSKISIEIFLLLLKYAEKTSETKLLKRFSQLLRQLQRKLLLTCFVVLHNYQSEKLQRKLGANDETYAVEK